MRKCLELRWESEGLTPSLEQCKAEGSIVGATSHDENENEHFVVRDTHHNPAPPEAPAANEQHPRRKASQHPKTRDSYLLSMPSDGSLDQRDAVVPSNAHRTLASPARITENVMHRSRSDNP